MEAGLYSVSFCFFLLLLLLLVLEELCSKTVPTTTFTTVRFLPGFNGPLPFELETGYVGVDDGDVQFFYYFIKSQRNPREDPLIFWNAGGPGCSGFFGIAFDIGPLRFNIAEYNGTLPTLVLNPNSWTKVSNIIFIDAPVGTGFSYSKSLHGSSTGDTKAARQTYDFLRKWLINHPKFRSNPLYIGGDSYAGMIVPITIQHVSNGPLHFKVVEYDGTLPTLVQNPNSWTKVSNIIFLDTPVGTGFSYSNSLESSKSQDTKSAKQTYEFLRKWLIDHPEFLSNPLYVGGDSYSGITVPLIVQDISDGIQDGDKPIINLKGYLLGNPSTDTKFDQNSLISYVHGMALLSDELYESTRNNCGEEYVNVDPSNALCLKDLQAVSESISQVNKAHILEPKCVLVSPKPKEMIGYRRSLVENSSKILFSPPSVPGLECRSYSYMLSYYWANNDSVQKSLNIRKGTVEEWIRCNYDIPYVHDVKSSIKYHLSLSSRSYRSLIYSGDHDALVPFLGTQAWIRSLNYSIIDDWRPWLVDGQVAGYTRTYSNNMTFATVKGGGHTAPEYRPKECLPMFERWISNDPL